jgi:hypothetical protein
MTTNGEHKPDVAEEPSDVVRLYNILHLLGDTPEAKWLLNHVQQLTTERDRAMNDSAKQARSQITRQHATHALHKAYTRVVAAKKKHWNELQIVRGLYMIAVVRNQHLRCEKCNGGILHGDNCKGEKVVVVVDAPGIVDYQVVDPKHENPGRRT